MTVFEWALPLRDDGRAGEPGRSRLHEPGGRVVIGPAQAEWPRREDRIGYVAGLASGQHRVARLKSILKVLGSGRLRAQRRRGASRPTHLRAAPATGCAVGAAVTESGTRGRFTGRPPCGSRSRRHWSCCRRLRHSRGCGQWRGADALHGGSGSAEARSRHKQRTLSGVPGCADARLRSCFAGWLNSRSEEMSPVSVFKFPSDTDDHGLVRYFVLRLDRTHEDAGDVHGV